MIIYAYLISFFIDFKSKNSSSNLDSLFNFRNFKHELLLFNKRTKFRFTIKNNELIIFFSDIGMRSRNRNISYSNLAVMASSYFYSILGYILYYHHIICFLVNSLQYDITSLGFFNWHEFMY